MITFAQSLAPLSTRKSPFWLPYSIQSTTSSIRMSFESSRNSEAFTSKRVHTCVACNKVGAEFRCTGCKQVTYCSKACQKTHWALHSKDCGHVSRRLKEEALAGVKLDAAAVASQRAMLAVDAADRATSAAAPAPTSAPAPVAPPPAPVEASPAKPARREAVQRSPAALSVRLTGLMTDDEAPAAAAPAPARVAPPPVPAATAPVPVPKPAPAPTAGLASTRTPYGPGTIQAQRPDGFTVVRMEWGATAYLNTAVLTPYGAGVIESTRPDGFSVVKLPWATLYTRLPLGATSALPVTAAAPASAAAVKALAKGEPPAKKAASGGCCTIA